MERCRFVSHVFDIHGVSFFLDPLSLRWSPDILLPFRILLVEDIRTMTANRQRHQEVAETACCTGIKLESRCAFHDHRQMHAISQYISDCFALSAIVCHTNIAYWMLHAEEALQRYTVCRSPSFPCFNVKTHRSCLKRRATLKV